MEVCSHTGSILDTAADVIVIGVATGGRLGPHAQTVNDAAGGVIQQLVDQQEITGKLYECTVLLAPRGLKASHIVVLGMGESPSVGDAFRIAAVATKSVTAKLRTQILLALDANWHDAHRESAVAGAMVGCVGQDLYRAEKKRIPPRSLAWADCTAEVCRRGQVLGESINLTRRLVNLAPQDMYPESFAEEVQTVAATHPGLEVEIWDEDRLTRENCGALLAVARGSARAPRLVIGRYRGDTRAPQPALGLVGKGVTFDSGGLSLKPSDGMKSMKCDMAGAATVLGTLAAIAQLELPIHVVGVMGLVENMVGGNCYKLGDVLTARNGRTIEVQNTDAEGRLVLADALDVTVELGAAKIVDLATLTGACVVALGNDVAGLMTNHEAWCQEVQSAATYCGEYVWQLPMFPEYGEQIRSEVADIKNVGDGRWGGAITAAKFLEEFVGKVPWVHIDIAGPSFLEKPKPWIDAGASGCLVRSLVELARRQSSQ